MSHKHCSRSATDPDGSLMLILNAMRMSRDLALKAFHHVALTRSLPSKDKCASRQMERGQASRRSLCGAFWVMVLEKVLSSMCIVAITTAAPSSRFVHSKVEESYTNVVEIAQVAPL